MDPHDIIGPNIAPNERWQGPTAAVTWGPHFEHVRIYGIDNRRHIVEWKQGSGESWQKPVVIEDQIEVAVGGSVTAMLSEDKERVSHPARQRRQIGCISQIDRTV